MKIFNKYNDNESGQALVGGIFFLLLVMLSSLYFVSVVNGMNSLYFDTLKNRFSLIEKTSKYANILNEIAINNQNIIASIISTQVAYISSIENGLTISYEQPYWHTYAKFSKPNGEVLSEQSKMTLEKSFQSNSMVSARGFMVAASLANENRKLIRELPLFIQSFFSHSTNNDTACLALEFLEPDLHNSKFSTFIVPRMYQFGVSKVNCSLEHKNNVLRQLIHSSLPVLYSNDSDLIIEFNKIDDYFNHAEKFAYGISFVKPEISHAFIRALQFSQQSRLETKVRITHPKFKCRQKTNSKGDFIVENDWNKNCTVSVNHFLKAFLTPNWAAIVTSQEKSLKKL